MASYLDRIKEKEGKEVWGGKLTRHLKLKLE